MYKNFFDFYTNVFDVWVSDGCYTTLVGWKIIGRRSFLDQKSDRFHVSNPIARTIHARLISDGRQIRQNRL